MNWETGDKGLNFRPIPSAGSFHMPTRKGGFYDNKCQEMMICEETERLHNVESHMIYETLQKCLLLEGLNMIVLSSIIQ